MSPKSAVLASFILAATQLFSGDPPIERPVIPSELTTLIGKADKVVVLENPMTDAKILFSSSNDKDLVELKEASVVVAPKPGESFHCMCIGEPAIKLFKDGKELIQFTNHHGMSIRCSLWSSDAEILDREKWLRWFDNRKITGPRAEVEAEMARWKQSELDEAKWVAAIPISLKPFWADEMKYSAGPGRSVNQLRLESALKTEFPETKDRIRALLTWFGSGAGPWSGYPGYEMVVEKLLSAYSTPTLIEAIQSKPLSTAQLEGSARLFAGFGNTDDREGDLKLLSINLKADLLKHVRGTITKESWESDWSVKDKWGRAVYAFGPK